MKCIKNIQDKLQKIASGIEQSSCIRIATSLEPIGIIFAIIALIYTIISANAQLEMLYQERGQREDETTLLRLTLISNSWETLNRVIERASNNFPELFQININYPTELPGEFKLAYERKFNDSKSHYLGTIQSDYGQTDAINALHRNSVSLEHLNMPLITFKNVRLSGADLSYSNFSYSSFIGDMNKVSFFKCLLYGTRFSEININNGNFNIAYMENASFDDASLTDSTFHKAILKNVDFGNANLTNASFQEAILSGTTLYKANVTGASFYLADLSGAEFRGVSGRSGNPPATIGLTQEQINKACYSGNPPILPKGFTPPPHCK